MSQQTSHALNLAGRCGFYCGTCRHYLARAKGLLKEKKLKHGCRGCRVQDKRCAWVKRDCVPLRSRLVTFCFECEVFPCDNLMRLDQRHVRDDGVGLIDNLLRIREIGAQHWLDEQRAAWTCPKCGGALCVMDWECYDCGYRFGRNSRGLSEAPFAGWPDKPSPDGVGPA